MARFVLFSPSPFLLSPGDEFPFPSKPMSYPTLFITPDGPVIHSALRQIRTCVISWSPIFEVTLVFIPNAPQSFSWSPVCSQWASDQGKPGNEGYDEPAFFDLLVPLHERRTLVGKARLFSSEMMAG
jgi:hypothetical protein